MNKKIIPPFLKEGDTIAITAPAGRVTQNSLARTIEIFNKWGLKTVLSEHLFDQYTYLSSNDENRLNDIQKMIDDKNIKAIFAARGGYGSVRIVDKINIDTLIKNPKWIIGFSDITVLHLLLNNAGIASIHGMMPNNPDGKRSLNDYDVTTMQNTLFGTKQTHKIPTHINNRLGTCEAELIGGNLSVICAMQGTPYAIKAEGKILLIEDIGERYYQIDRMIHNLKLSGILSKLSGLIVGSMTDIKETEIPLDKSICEIINESVKDYNYPVCFDFPSGHTKNNSALIFGRQSKLTVNKDTTTLE